MAKSKTTPKSRTERTSALLKEQEKAEKRRQMIVIGAIVVVLALIGGATWFAMSKRNVIGGDNAKPHGSSADYGLVRGEDGADHQVVIYEDFLCPWCGQFERGSRDIMARAIADGSAQVEYRPINLLSSAGQNDNYSMRATNAFAVVLDQEGPEVAMKFHNNLYDNQPAEGGTMPADSWLVDQAVAAGASEDKIKTGITDLAFEDWVTNGADAASQAGVMGTPTILVDGKQIEGKTIDEVIGNFEAAVNK